MATSLASYSPLKELVILRVKEFYREPEAVFWVYVFPVLMMFCLGIAFRGGEETLRVGVAAGPEAESVRRALDSRSGFRVEVAALAEAQALYAAGKLDLVVEATGGAYRFTLDPGRSEARVARLKVNDALQAEAGRRDAVPSEDIPVIEPGSRYIDWLIPGLMGMNIMGGGLWGLGFVTVDLRMRKLLKRFLATPMRRSDFLLSLMASRLLFLVSEISAILGVGHFVFGLEVRGSMLAVGVVILLGALSFSGLGLLVACRADKIETISGLSNVVMLPMWLLSGVFFSSDRFPDAMQPLVQALPLTQLNNALRSVILDGASLSAQSVPALILTAYGALAFAAALRWFRWL